MLGADQEQWLEQGFAKAGARWNVLANGQMLLHHRILNGKRMIRYGSVVLHSMTNLPRHQFIRSCYDVLRHSLGK